jgi:glycine dehydrogenase subunit 1
VTAATLYLALLGPAGLADVARACHANTLALVSRLTRIRGVARAFSGAIFHEAVLRLPVPVAPVLRALRAQRILGGRDLGQDFPELGHALLVCATETRTEEDLARYAAHLERVIDQPPRSAASTPETGT